MLTDILFWDLEIISPLGLVINMSREISVSYYILMIKIAVSYYGIISDSLTKKRVSFEIYKILLNEIYRKKFCITYNSIDKHFSL